MPSTNTLGNVKSGKTVFFLCDMQERFRTAIKHFNDILEVSRRLVSAAKILKIPLVVTEQYPKGLGNTVSELQEATEAAVGVFQKTKFSMMIPEVEHRLPDLCDGALKHIVVFGVETHVCVQQTVIDLLQKNYEVYVVADATSSRSSVDRKFALERIRQAGAIVTTAESLLLQLVGNKDHQFFKEIHQIIRSCPPQSGL
ncbi:DgyrCDS5201 [Dimorphilus gyrociliatus]|uniref:Isochorismatase domain-containing protein 1 n=1 Tax=Dimorphilus gyrociliatus TaxID=2664684 RepID=A0A7I8VJ97_9ANNE|nr:DgyrCDS5201 [Dimorphilus gyrociliatus]